MDVQPDLDMRILSKPHCISAVKSAIEAMALAMGMKENDGADTALAVHEALANVIKHGYGNKPDQPIQIRVSYQTYQARKAIQVVIEDESNQINLNEIKSRSLEEVRPGGLGVHIIQRIMDQVEYSHRGTGSGLRLTISKFIDPHPPRE